jgi:predicted membrane-bound spermidine synthase
MSQTLGRGYLYLLVTVAGFTTLGVELSAARLLDPWFGNSLIVWAGLIGLILLYLAVGYWLGGRIADRWPQPTVLLGIAGVAAFTVGLIPALARPVLRLAADGLAGFDAGLLAASMAAVLILFAVPITLLGCISPYAIRLTLDSVQSGGSTAGRIYAYSTAGSIAGSFLPVLFLIPNIGTRATFAVLSAALLAVVGLGCLALRRWPGVLLAALGIAVVLWLGWRPIGPVKPSAGLIYETESLYNYIQVLDFGVERQLRLNEGEGIHSVYRPAGGPAGGPTGQLADGIWDYFTLAPAFNPAPYDTGQVRRIYIGGLAAGTMARLFTDAYGPVAIDGVELDPAILAAGRAYFDMNQPNLNAVAADARRFLRQSEGRYDVIALDAYRPPYIPFHLTTVEFFDLARRRLNPDGVVVVNVGRTQDDYSLVDAIAATLGQVFPSVYVVDEPSGDSPLGNTMVVATARPTTLADFRANLSGFDHPLLTEVARRATPQAKPAAPPPTAPIFTDDRAPVEQVVHALVLRHFLGR